MKQFNDLQFVKLYDGVQAKTTYGEYELSVIQHSSSSGGTQGLYEIAVFKGDGQIEMPGITENGQTVKGWLTEEDVSGIMKKMSYVSGPR